MLRNKASWLSSQRFCCSILCAVGSGLARRVPDPLQRRGSGTISGPAPCTRWCGSFPSTAFMFRIFGLYRGMWVFASLPDLDAHFQVGRRPAR